jgi:hypothetical protein
MIVVKKEHAIRVARLAALAIRQKVRDGRHYGTVKGDNTALDRFVTAIEHPFTIGVRAENPLRRKTNKG